MTLGNHGKSSFQQGDVDTFVLDLDLDIGTLQTVTVSMCDGCADGWRVARIVITNLATMVVYTFLGDGSIIKGGHSAVLTPGEEKETILF